VEQADAFLQAICAKPEDDTPRLVYADWLEEQGDTDRAEFIRVQCELEKVPPGLRPCSTGAATRATRCATPAVPGSPNGRQRC
jgi:uncharacterized protein (TIGR02996 family)